MFSGCLMPGNPDVGARDQGAIAAFPDRYLGPGKD